MAGSCSQSHFHKDEYWAGPGDEIDFAALPAQIARQDFQAGLLQVLRCQRFSLCAEDLGWRGRAFRGCQPVRRWLTGACACIGLPAAYGLGDAFGSGRIQPHAGDGRLAESSGAVRHNGRKRD